MCSSDLAKLHHELVPFFYSLAEEAYAGGQPIIRPVGDAPTWPGDYRYMLGDAWLVAPLLDASGVRDVSLPVGQWYDWWRPGDDPITGGQTLSAYDVADAARIPLFVKRGAIVPLSDASEVTGLGTAASANLRTVLVYPDSAPSSFTLHDDDDALTTIGAESGANGSRVTLSRARGDTVLRVRADSMPSSVEAGGGALTQHLDRAAFDVAPSGWLADSVGRFVWVKVAAQGGEVQVSLLP